MRIPPLTIAVLLVPLLAPAADGGRPAAKGFAYLKEARNATLTGKSSVRGGVVSVRNQPIMWTAITAAGRYRLLVRVRAGYADDHTLYVKPKGMYSLAVDGKQRPYAVLENTLAEMRSVEHDLKSGRYKSAARRAHYAVDNLRTAKDAVLGEAEVRADRAAALPRELQREILDALDSGLPKGYEDLVKAYYERLAQEQ